MDGGADLTHHFSLSGESKASQVIITDNDPLSMTELAALNVAKREYQKQYMDYWNSTAELTGTGRPVDGFFCPLAPHAAVIPNEYHYVGYTTFVNVLDYTSVAVPVTFADKSVDVRSADASTAKSAEHIEWKCKSFVFICEGSRLILSTDDADTYHGAPVGVQFVGRRLQEEKMLTLAEYLGGEISKTAEAK